MCNFVVPIRTCSKCHQNEPLFDERRLSSMSDKNERKQAYIYIEPPQDCFSRWCIFSSEHPGVCIGSQACWLTCKQTHGKTREIQGGSPSYVCHSCAHRSRRTLQAALWCA
ncbi:hypothetical protein DFH29DRAFT_953495 [Suillus ampliporus]|nr:hypothetical protein DFH29DRAFT_953495 [Suillus ampliporus]